MSIFSACSLRNSVYCVDFLPVVVLLDLLQNIAHDQRGQMRQTVWALKDVAPFIKKLKITGVNTGIGNVVANKGGIIISMIYQDTRISFLSAHLAAHEGEHYYNNRCKNVYDILKGSKTFDLCNKHSIDLALASHHMFVCGDLNFRTKFDGVDNSHDDNVRRAGELIEAKDWKSLYSFDELHKGILGGDLLVGFNTLPCDFNPTFKVNRCEGFDYKDQRTPSYTDRILFKSSPGLHENIKQLTYEPCVDFITSDHKPVRGAFSIVPNDMIRPLEIPGKYRIEFTQLECENLPIADTASSDPYILFVWDMAELQEEGRNRLSVMNRKKGFPATSFKSKTLNPKWPNKKISLVTSGQEMTFDTMLFLVVYDFDFMSDDDILGTLPLNINHLLTMKPGETTKELTFNSPLERYGKYEGRIKFKLEVSMLVG
jgi:phosphatidylinositol-3,4,5-trisphosphate 5-phosphatase 2